MLADVGLAQNSGCLNKLKAGPGGMYVARGVLESMLGQPVTGDGRLDEPLKLGEPL